MTDTPETDRQDTVITKPRRTEWVSKEFARRMERERDRWRSRSNELAEALRKAVAWGEEASNHILYRERINWRYLDEARATLAAPSRELAGYYRDDDENKRKREAAMAAAIRAGNCDHLQGPETHSS